MKKNLNQQLKDAFSALDEERVKSLLAAGADKNCRVRNKLLLWTCGVQKPRKPVKPKLCDDEEINAYHQKSYLEWVQEYPKEVEDYNRHIKYMTLLLENGANPNTIDREPSTWDKPLLLSLLDGVNLEEAELLVKHGAKAFASDAIWITEHRIDCNYGLKLVKFLYEHGANINAKDYEGDTALMKLTGFDNIVDNSSDLFETTKWLTEPVEYFVTHGAKVNIRDRKQRTALVRSLKQNWDDYYSFRDKAWEFRNNFCSVFYYEIPTILMQNGARVSIKDESGKDAMNYAAADEEKMDLFARAIDDSNKFLRRKIVVMSK